jgi:uroporphyrinogen decarboxylase
MKEVPLEDNRQVFEFYEKLSSGKIDAFILLTGVGTKAMVETLETRFPREAVLDTLRRTVIVPRGPKPIRVLKEWNIPYALTVPEPNTWREILDTLDKNAAQVPLKGKRIAVQEYGVTNPALIQGLEERGASVERVPVYRWTLPDDLAPLERAIRDILENRVQLAFFTTAVQIEHALKVAGRMGVEENFKTALNGLVVASVGPDTTDALKLNGITPDIEPESPKMGPLVVAAAEKAKTILLNESVFMKACRREKTPYTPVWLMRQAGRYMQDYRALREKHSFLDLCKNKDLASEVTVTAQEKLGVDAAIIFSDILLIVESFGLGLRFEKGDGPSIERPIRSAADVEKLPQADTRRDLRFVADAIELTRRNLKPNIPLIGFAGAPFTVASYMIEGGSSQDFSKTKAFMKENEKAWHLLLEKLAKATVPYLEMQIEAGAQALQLFDSWAGKLTAAEYEKFVLPHSKYIFASLERRVPTIHFGAGTKHLLPLMAQAGADVIGVDSGISLKDAWPLVGYDKAVQGNFDPKLLLTDEATIKREVKKILDEAAGRPGHIFNLGHGVLPETPVENAAALVRAVHELSRR